MPVLDCHCLGVYTVILLPSLSYFVTMTAPPLGQREARALERAEQIAAMDAAELAELEYYEADWADDDAALAAKNAAEDAQIQARPGQHCHCNRK
jgi:hypothetical protein